MERIENIKENDLKNIAIPLKEIDRVIDNGIYQTKRKFLNENDVIWNSETNNHKRKVWIHYRSETKAVVSPNRKIKFLHPLVEGYCSLYLESIPVINADGDYIRTDFNYYLQRKGEYLSTLFYGRVDKLFSDSDGEYIRTKNIDYFDNCSKTSEHIKLRKKLSKKEIIELVKLYNQYCGA